MTLSTPRWTALLCVAAALALMSACRDSPRSLAPTGTDGAAAQAYTEQLIVTTDNTVRDMGVGGKETMGILAYGDSDVRITDNTVERNRWSSDFGPDQTLASCILIFESDGVRVRDNSVRNCDAGIAVGSSAWLGPSADDAVIGDNGVTNALVGVFLRPGAFPGFSSADASTSNAKINGNVLSAGSIGEVGIAITPLDAHDEYDAIARNNKVVRNAISGFADEQLLDEGTATRNPGNNVIQP